MKYPLMICAVSLIGFPIFCRAHRPVMGPRPETLWQDGTSIDFRHQYDRARTEERQELSFDVGRGITSNFMLRGILPLVRATGTGRHAHLGLGDITAEAVWRFFIRRKPGIRVQASALALVRLPTHYQHSMPSQGFSSIGFAPPVASWHAALGFVAAYESLRWFWYISSVYEVTSRDHGIKPGEEWRGHTAMAWRPRGLKPHSLDIAFLLELTGIIKGHDEQYSHELPITGGMVLLGGPSMGIGFGLSTFLKAGLQLPLAQHIPLRASHSELRSAISLEVTF